MAWDRPNEPYRPRESSGVLIFRVVVMLSCLILVPLAAIFGSAFPELVRTQLVDRVKALAGGSPPAAAPVQPGIDEAPAYTPLVADRNGAFGQHPSEAAPDWQPAAGPATAHQVDYTTPVVNIEPPAMEFSSPPATQPPAVHSVDHFTEIQHRLREYGAVHYALESVAADGAYRFHCTMSAVGAAAPQKFEATDRDPLRAMANVLAQVEAWRAQANAPAAAWQNSPS